MIFGSWFGNKYADNPKYLFMTANMDKKIRAIWITKNENVYRELKDKGYEVYFRNSLKGIIYQLRAKYYFTCTSRNDVNFIFMGGAVHVELWHGIPLKKIMYDDVISKIKKEPYRNKMKYMLNYAIYYLPIIRNEYIVSSSDEITKIYYSAFKKDKKHILQLGQPRNDVFFTNKFEDDKFQFNYENKKIILYMPTHRNEGKTEIPIDKIFDLEDLNNYCIKNNWIFLIKKHYYHCNEKKDFGNYECIKDITCIETDSQLLLKYTDILITDYSSCYIDYLLLDRPIIFYNYDYDAYVRNDRELYFDYNDVTPGEKVSNYKELITNINDYLVNNKDNFFAQRQKIKRLFYSESNEKMTGDKILKYIKEYL
jgi:CDP-glycerol glycerophosphotransferase (TagB/SpsB family)